MNPIAPISSALDPSSLLSTQLQSTGIADPGSSAISTDGSLSLPSPLLGDVTGATTGAAQVGDPAAAASGFTQALTDAIGSVAGLQTNADQAVAGLALNQGVDIHQAMIAMEQASLGMQMAVEVRDKAVEAYQSLANMQM